MLQLFTVFAARANDFGLAIGILIGQVGGTANALGHGTGKVVGVEKRVLDARPIGNRCRNGPRQHVDLQKQGL